MIDTEPEHVIQVICTDARHARGKVAKVVAFGRFTLGGQVRWLIRGKDGEWRYTRPDAEGGVYRRYGDDADKGATYSWRCPLPLCTRSFEPREGTLPQVLELIHGGLLKTIGSHSVSEINISVLREVASKQP